MPNGYETCPHPISGTEPWHVRYPMAPGLTTRELSFTLRLGVCNILIPIKFLIHPQNVSELLILHTYIMQIFP